MKPHKAIVRINTFQIAKTRFAIYSGHGMVNAHRVLVQSRGGIRFLVYYHSAYENARKLILEIFPKSVREANRQ